VCKLKLGVILNLKKVIFDGQDKPLKISKYYFLRLFLTAKNKPILFLGAKEKPPKIRNSYFQQKRKSCQK
jgi:hypothetical protein